MRKMTAFTLILCLLAVSGLADPLTMLEDLTGTLCWPEDSTEETATYLYHYNLPQVDDGTSVGETINEVYRYQLADTIAFTLPIQGEMYEVYDEPSSTTQTYRVTCNDEQIFSVLQIRETVAGGERQVAYSAQIFGRTSDKPGLVLTLPYLLGILEDQEMDEWLKERQTGRASDCVRQLIWEEIERRADEGLPVPDITEEALSYEFYPEEDFYYDGELHALVFFLQPYLWEDPDIALSLTTFPLTIDEILDEL